MLRTPTPLPTASLNPEPRSWRAQRGPQPHNAPNPKIPPALQAPPRPYKLPPGHSAAPSPPQAHRHHPEPGPPLAPVGTRPPDGAPGRPGALRPSVAVLSRSPAVRCGAERCGVRVRAPRRPVCPSITLPQACCSQALTLHWLDAERSRVNDSGEEHTRKGVASSPASPPPRKIIIN